MAYKKVTRRFEDTHKSIALTGFLTVIIAYFLIFHNMPISIKKLECMLKGLLRVYSLTIKGDQRQLCRWFLSPIVP